MALPDFQTIHEIKLGHHLLRFKVIESRTMNGHTLPPRGLVETWVLTPKGAVDGHRHYPAAIWQGTAAEIIALADELHTMAAIVRTLP
jgi:hypothetical protein